MAVEVGHEGADLDARRRVERLRVDARARDQDREAFIEGVRAEIEQHVSAELVPAYMQAAPLDQLYLGLERYWRKRAEAVDAA